MTIVLYDLAGVDDRRFSPNCWRTRMALAHKGLDYEARPTRFTEIGPNCHGHKTVPTLVDEDEDGDKIVCESRAIAEYLEDTYPERPSLFGGVGGRALSVFFENWTNATLHANVGGMTMLDIYDHLLAEDRDYFRASREQRFGKTLEQVQAGREQRLPEFRQKLTPLRATLQRQPFLGGDRPLYPDYLAFGAFQWARVVSPFRLLERDDVVHDWFQRCLDLYGGLGRSTPGYD